MSGAARSKHKIKRLIGQLQKQPALAVASPKSPKAEKAAEKKALLEALDGAVMLEFATIPTYLMALWTIRDELHPMAKSLRNILQEEMLHLALVCNMMVSIGGTPRINTAAPTYPGKLPLGVHPELTVPLGRFSPDTLAVFMEIERPEFIEPEDPDDCHEAGIHEHADLTIGQLYGEILAAFKRLDPPFKQDRQVTGPLSWLPILKLQDVEDAIEIIERQGEGSLGKPEERRGHFAHYWRFAEMHKRKRLTKSASGKWEFTDPIPFDFDKDVRPVADVPKGGYVLDPAKQPEAHHLLRQFNLTYSKMLDALQATWSGVRGQARILEAVALMFELEKYAKPLMEIEIADKSGMTYGPDFTYIPETKRR